MRCYCNTDLGRSSTFLSAAVAMVDDQGAVAPDPHIDSGCQVVEQPLPFSLWASWRPLWLGRTPSADRSCRADVKRLQQASSLRSSGSEEGREGRSGGHCGRNAEVGQLASAPSSDSAEARSSQLPFGGNPCRQGWSYGKCSDQSQQLDRGGRQPIRCARRSKIPKPATLLSGREIRRPIAPWSGMRFVWAVAQRTRG